MSQIPKNSSNSSDLDSIENRLSAIERTFRIPQVVTTFPASPAKGQEVYYQSEPGTIWHCKSLDGISWTVVGLPGFGTGGSGNLKYSADSNGGVLIPNTGVYTRMKVSGGGFSSFSITTGQVNEYWAVSGQALAQADSANDTTIRARITEATGTNEFAVAFSQRLYYNGAANLSGYFSIPVQNIIELGAGTTTNFYFEMAAQSPFGLQNCYAGGTTHNNFRAQPIGLHL